jgi:hypothetical protein
MTTLNLINDALILATCVLALIAFGYMALGGSLSADGLTLRRPLSRAFAWLCFAVYFGVTMVTLDLMFL